MITTITSSRNKKEYQVFLLLLLIVFIIIYYSDEHFVRGQSVSPTCENVEVFFTTNNYNSFVCNDYNKSWKNSLLNGTFSYSGSSTRKVLIYQGLVGSKINYRYSSCSSSTFSQNYAMLINDMSIMNYPYLNPSVYCATKDACNLGISKASSSDVAGLSYAYLKDYSNKMTMKRLTTEELLIQSMFLYLCYVPSTTLVVDLGITSKPSPIVITSNQSVRNATNDVIMKNSGTDTITDLYLDVKFESLPITNLDISIVKIVRINHPTNTQSSILSYTLAQVNSNTAKLSLSNVNLQANQSAQVFVTYKWRNDSLISANTTSQITYTTSMSGKYYDPMANLKVQTSSISLIFPIKTNTNGIITNSTSITNSTKTSNSTVSNTTPSSNSTVYVDPNTSGNVYYSDYGKPLAFQIGNSKNVIIASYVSASTSDFIQVSLNFTSTFNGSVVLSSSLASTTFTIPLISVSTSSFIVPTVLLNDKAKITLKITNSKATNTTGVITMMKKSIKSMSIDQVFSVPKPTINGEINALRITSFSSRDNTPQDISIQTSNLSKQPYFLFIIQGDLPTTLDISKAYQFTSLTNTYNTRISFKEIPIGSLVIIVENDCDTCSASMTFTIPGMYSNPPSLAVSGVYMQSLAQTSSGSYPYYISYNPTESQSYLLALVTVQNLKSSTSSGQTYYIPKSLSLTATQGTIERSSNSFSKTSVVNCLNENTNTVSISTWLQPSTNGIWKFNLRLDPSFTSSNTIVNYVLQSISAAQMAFSISSDQNNIIQLPYYSAPTEDTLQRLVVNTNSNNFQITMVLDSQNLLFDRTFRVYLGVGKTPSSSKYDIFLDFYPQTNYKVNIVGYENGIIIEAGSKRALIASTFLKLQDKAIYMLFSPKEPYYSQSCNPSSFSQAKLSYLMTTTPSMVTISSKSYLNKFTVNPGTIINVDLSDINYSGNYLIELFSQQFTSIPTPTIYAFSNYLETISITRNDYVQKQYQTTLKSLKFISELNARELSKYSSIIIRFPQDKDFETALFRGTAENIVSEEKLYIENYFFESYITAGSIVGLVLLYSLLFTCVFCIQTIRKKKINIDNEKEWESFIPALFTTLPMFLAIRVCRLCIKSKDERERKYNTVFMVGTILLILALAWLGGFGSVVGITIFETVSLMKEQNVDLILSKSVRACCVVQSGTYIDSVYSSVDISTLGNTYKCMNLISPYDHITDFFVNSNNPTTPIDVSYIDGGLTGVAMTNLNCKGSKVIYVPDKFELARYLCIAATFGLFILGFAIWYYLFLVIACIQAPKRKRYAIKAPSSSSKSAISTSGKPLQKKQQSMINKPNSTPQQQLPRTLSTVHRSPTSPTKNTHHTFADYEIFFPTKESNTPLNRKLHEYEMYDVPILNTPPPIYTPYPQSPRSPPRSTAYYTYESPSTNPGYGNMPVSNGMLPPPPYNTIILPPAQDINGTHYDDNIALNIPTPEAVKMTSQ